MPPWCRIRCSVPSLSQLPCLGPRLHTQDPFIHCQITVALSEDVWTKIDFHPRGACGRHSPSAASPRLLQGLRRADTARGRVPGPFPRATLSLPPAEPGCTRERVGGRTMLRTQSRGRAMPPLWAWWVPFLLCTHLGRTAGGVAPPRALPTLPPSHRASRAGLCPSVTSVVPGTVTGHHHTRSLGSHPGEEPSFGLPEPEPRGEAASSECPPGVGVGTAPLRALR